MTYQYPKIIRRKAKLPAPAIETEKAPEEVVGLIHGQTPDSVEEWRAHVALVKFKVEHLYQVPIRGGRTVRGGMLVDFLLLVPFPWPAEMLGEFWHTGAMGDEDRLRMAILEHWFGRPPILWWASEFHNQEAADAVVRKTLKL